jgi:hypothetical protein
MGIMVNQKKSAMITAALHYVTKHMNIILMLLSLLHATVADKCYAWSSCNHAIPYPVVPYT